MDRKLAAILVADFVGSTSEMEVDEERAIVRISGALDLAQSCISSHSGRVFNTAGDAVLAEFSSPVSALRAATDLRARLASTDGLSPRDMRFGLHVADVVAEGADLKGDGVNIAARLQEGADPGEIDVSELLYSHVRRVSPCRFRSVGARVFKGVSEPVEVMRVVSSTDRHVHLVAPTVAHPQVTRRPNSVAVMPLRVASSADEDQAFLADGLTEDLIHELSQFRSLHVSSRTASQALEESDPVEIGATLGVRFLLSGSVRKLGPRVRINIALSDTDDGAVIWSDRIQRPYDELLDAMDEITSRVASTVSGRIDHAGIAAARRKRPENMTAYEYYLRGLDHHRLAGADGRHVDKAITWFHRAQEADPGFGRPYAMEVCAWSYRPDFDLRAAEHLLNKALKLDPSDPEVHRILGVHSIKLHGDYDSSRTHHEMAMELAPNDAYILGRCAAFYTFVGEPQRALDLLERADALDPFLPVWIIEERIAAFYALGDYLSLSRTARTLPFQTRRSRCYRAAARVALGQPERASALIAEALADDPALSIEYVVSQELYRDRGLLSTLTDRLQQAGLPEQPSVGHFAAEAHVG